MRSTQPSFRLVLLFAVLTLLAVNCRVWSPSPDSPPATLQPTLTQVGLPPAQVTQPPQQTPEPEPIHTIRIPRPPIDILEIPAGEPAGCLNAEAQAALGGPMGMLAYADSLLDLKLPLSERLSASVWNAATGEYDFSRRGAYAFTVGDVQNEYWIQIMMNALHTAGFVTWLRTGPGDALHILAIPLDSADALQPGFPWAVYISAYWQDRFSLPAHDPTVMPALKLPPCRWMVAQGYAPEVQANWWAAASGVWPDYSRATSTYAAADSRSAAVVAQQIDWLGAEGVEAPNTMCGPLSWAIIRDAGAFPPGVGEWAKGGIAFWLARPLSNGRPWSLFPPGTYTVHHFRQPLSQFDFNTFPLYPGDFLYLYSKKDGFDHMLVVTEVDAEGNVYTVTNIVKVHPEEKTTIERVVLYNANDPAVGIARNAWAKDGRNGRTGHDGFDVFRWTWMEKDISGQPAAYTVQIGDTLGLIAERWKTPAHAIAEYNKLRGDVTLTIGQELLIPPNAQFLSLAAPGR